MRKRSVGFRKVSPLFFRQGKMTTSKEKLLKTRDVFEWKKKQNIYMSKKWQVKITTKGNQTRKKWNEW